MAQTDLEDGEIEEGEIVEDVLRPGPFLPRVPFKAHPDAQAQPESTLGHTSRAILPGAPLATPAPSHPCSAAADPAQHEVQTEGGPISFASSSSKESAELQSFSFPAQAPVSPHTALQAAGWQQMPPGSLVPFTIRSPRQQNSVQQQASSRSQPSLSAEGPPRVPSSALRDRDVQSRSSSHAYTRPHARSTSAPRRRHENLREREFREQQKESSSSLPPKSRSSSVEAGQIKPKGLSPAGIMVERSRSSPRGTEPRSSERERGRSASGAGRSWSRDAHRSRDRSKARTATKEEEALRRQSEAERREREAERREREAVRRERDRKQREEERQMREERLVQEREERRKRDREADERRRIRREEREKQELADEATRLASGIRSLCEDCTMKDIMKSLDTVVTNLHDALYKLYSLHRIHKKMAEAGVDREFDTAELAATILDGLRQLRVFSQTGGGQAALRGNATARELVRSAVRNKNCFCTVAQQAALEGLVKASTVFTAYISDAPPAELPARAPSCTPTKAAQPPGLTSPAQPASKRQRREAAPLQNGPGQLSTDLSKSDPGAAAARPPDSPPSPPTPPSEPGEAEPDQDAVSDLSDSQNLYANTAAEPGDEAVSAAADDFLPFSPETPSESPERASSAGPSDEPAAAAPRPASAAPVAVPGLHNGPAPSRLLRSSRRQNTRSVPSSAQPLVTDTISASTGPGNQKGPASAEQRTGAAQRGSGGASTSGRELHSAYRQSGPVGELLRQRRLCLVLDLDHTLLNSAKFSEVDPDHLKLLERQLQREAGLPAEERRLFRLDHIAMWTVLRPGLRQMLARVAPLFQLWIQTNASRAYALAVAELLDPTGELFGQRIISKGDDGSVLTNQSKRLMQGLEECEAVCIIVDDSNDVWRHHVHNLLHVERYIYFPSSRRQLKVRRCFLEAQNDECEKSGILAVTLKVLLRVHTAVFAALDAPASAGGRGEHHERVWDVRHVLGLLRKQVLPGVRVLFSRVFPLEQAPSEHQLWKLAETYGCSCTTELDEQVTHVVASSRGTHKAQWALHAGKHIVSPAWLECSCTLWQQAEESRFPAPP